MKKRADRLGDIPAVFLALGTFGDDKGDHAQRGLGLSVRLPCKRTAQDRKAHAGCTDHFALQL